MISMTYGRIPHGPAFDELFEKACPNGVYTIRHGISQPEWAPRAGSYTRDELREEIGKLVDLQETAQWGDEETPGSWACDIMTTLGIQWI